MEWDGTLSAAEHEMSWLIIGLGCRGCVLVFVHCPCSSDWIVRCPRGLCDATDDAWSMNSSKESDAARASELARVPNFGFVEGVARKDARHPCGGQ